MLAARDFRHVRPAAGSDQDMFGAVALAFDFDGMCIDQLRMRLQQGHAAVHQDAAIDAVQALNLAILVGDQGLPVEGRAVDGPAVALRLADVLSVVRTVDQQLLRHTADVDAGAAQVAALGDGHFRAKACSEARRTYATGTRTDDE